MSDQTKMYGGKYLLQFNDEKHQYSVLRGDGSWFVLDGVTTVLSRIAKPALVPWAVGLASKYIDEKLIVGKAVDEIEKKKIVDGCKLVHKQKTEEAGDIGTLFHGWVERYIDKEKVGMPQNEMMRGWAEQFLSWEKQNKVEWKASERRVMSVKHGYAGTLDFTAIVDGEPVLGDVKTSSGIWDEYWLQTSAYQLAIEEEFGKKGIYKKHVILRFDKKTGKMEVKENYGYNKNKKAFLATLQLHRWLKNMKKKN